MRLFFLLLIGLFAGCESVGRQIYISPGGVRTVRDGAFTLDAPRSWGLILPTGFVTGDQKDAILIGITRYDSSPLIQFDKLPETIPWQTDLPKMKLELTRRSENQAFAMPEELTRYNKFEGHGARGVGKFEGRRLELILFYPEGELTGSRLLLTLYDSPNATALREMDEILRSVRYAAPQSTKGAP
ncbi:MAG: hypothetical protein RLZZ15_2283 [Verrucomicrobiota bacterium]|jgi:hypothetical protein